jgi:lysophospholipase L1-like esterase
LSAIVKRVLDEYQVTYLDLGPLLQADRVAGNDQRSDAAETGGWLRLFAKQLLPDVFAAIRLRQINVVQEEQTYIDHVHPSRKGNEMIAAHLFEQLSTLLEPSAPVGE